MQQLIICSSPPPHGGLAQWRLQTDICWLELAAPALPEGGKALLPPTSTDPMARARCKCWIHSK